MDDAPRTGWGDRGDRKRLREAIPHPFSNQQQTSFPIGHSIPWEHSPQVFK